MSVTAESGPAVLVFGTDDMQRRQAAVRKALEVTGKPGRWVNLSTGAHRGYVTQAPPAGHEVTRRSLHWLASNIGQAAEDVAAGTTFEVWDHQRDEAAFYVTLAPPEALVRSGAALRYMTRARRGKLARSLWLEFASATETQAKAVKA